MMAFFLKELWRDLTLRDLGRIGFWDVVMALLMWLMVLLMLALMAILVGWLGYVIYRRIAYDYETETLTAKVTHKKHKATHMTYAYNPALKVPMPTYHDAEYNVHFVTKRYGLQDVIDDKNLYDWAVKGAKFTVTMKIGRDRSPDREIKYWRVTYYSWY